MAEVGDWSQILSLDELPNGKPVPADASGVELLVYRAGDRVFAVANRCTHQGAALNRGVVRPGPDPAVTCPAHGSVFRLADGRVLRGPATVPVQAYEARIQDGATVEVRPTDGAGTG